MFLQLIFSFFQHAYEIPLRIHFTHNANPSPRLFPYLLIATSCRFAVSLLRRLSIERLTSVQQGVIMNSKVTTVQPQPRQAIIKHKRVMVYTGNKTTAELQRAVVVHSTDRRKDS